MPSTRGNTHRPDPVLLFGAASVLLPLSGTPNQEPEWRRSSQPLDVFAKRCRWQRFRQGKTRLEVAVGGTSLIPDGPDNGTVATAFRQPRGSLTCPHPPATPCPALAGPP